jgi:hypothetical protein
MSACIKKHFFQPDSKLALKAGVFQKKTESQIWILIGRKENESKTFCD